MVRYSSSIIVPYTRERVFALMSDWKNLATWDFNITKSELSQGQKEEQIGLGTKYDCAFSLRGTEIPVDYECIEYEQPNVAKFLGLATLFRSEDMIRCEVNGENSTKLTAEFNLRFRGLLTPLSFVLNKEMQKTGPVVMRDIEEFVNNKLAQE